MTSIDVSATGTKLLDNHGYGYNHHNTDAAYQEARRVRDSKDTDLNAANSEARRVRDDSHQSTAITNGFTVTQVQIERARSELQNSLGETRFELAQAQERGFNQARTDLFNESARAATERIKFAGEAALTAATNTAAIQAALAACCCEIKELVREDGGKTRQLLSDNTVQHLRDQLQASQQDALIARLSGGHTVR